MIGGFVVTAVVILTISVVIFGSGDFLKKKKKFVLYFDESVKGLNVGSPVLFNGVPLGTVVRIVMRSYVADLSTTIPVFIEIYPDSYEVVAQGTDIISPEGRMPELIKVGLRAQLVTQSLVTGKLLIELNLHPDTPVTLKNLDKDYVEVPTILSTWNVLGEELEKIDLAESFTRLTSVLLNAERILKDPSIEASLRELKGVLTDARVLVNNVDTKVAPLANNLNNTLADVRGLVNNVDKEVKPVSGELKTTLDDIAKLARNADAKMDPLSKTVANALDSAAFAFKNIDGLVGKKSPTRADLDTALQELAMAARSLRALADYIEQHPDSLLKGKGYTGY